MVYKMFGKIMRKESAIYLIALFGWLVSGCEMQSMRQNDQTVSSPKRQWLARYSAQKSLPFVKDRGHNEPAVIKADDQGNVYVAGCSSIKYSMYSSAIVKYDYRGKEMWSATYPIELEEPDQVFHMFAYNADDIAIDIHQNVFVAGHFLYCQNDCSTTKGGLFTLKYNGKGSLIWSRFNYGDMKYGGSKGAVLALDGSGNVIVAMNSYTIKFDNDGNEVWKRSFPHHFFAGEIAVDSNGNSIVRGGSSFFDAFNGVIKHDSEGNRSIITDEPIVKMSLGVSGNLYLATREDMDSRQGIRLMKYNSEGNILWSSIYDNKIFQELYLDYMAVDNSECVYVVGSNSSRKNSNRYLITKYDSEGNVLWSNDYNFGINLTFKSEKVIVDSTGLTILLAADFGCREKSIVNLSKIDQNGNFLWTSKQEGAFGVPYPRSESERFVTQDNSGNLYVTGCGGICGGDFVTLKLIQQ